MSAIFFSCHSKFVVKAKKAKDVGENPDEDEDVEHRGLDRPEING